MFFDDLSLINNDSPKFFDGKELNYARLILPERESEIIVIGEYTPKKLGETFITLDKSGNESDSNDWDNFYYGASPELDSYLIVDAISKLNFATEEGLNDFVKKHSNLFMLHEQHKRRGFLFPLAKYITLSFSYNYGIKFVFEASLAKEIAEADKDNPFLTLSSKQSQGKENEATLIIHGCPTQAVLKHLRRYRYSRNEENGNAWKALPEGKDGVTVENIYSEKKNISLIGKSEFYSGVVLRALGIEEKDSWHTNEGKDITTMSICYERSTFATVYALDNNYTNHPIIKNDKKKIVEFFFEDDRIKYESLKKHEEPGSKGRKNLISAINQYLKASFGVNQIGVSGSIISSDGFLVFTERGKKAVDSRKLYPSVNGNAEIADKKVSFYADSVQVDLPTLCIDSTYNSFGNELCREAAAELNLSLNDNLLKCNGIVISGILPENPENLKINEEYPDNYPDKFRRLHINVLFTQEVDLDFKKIQAVQSKAVEKYEVNRLYGLSVKKYKNHLDFIINGFLFCLKWILKSRLFITNVFTIMLFSMSSPGSPLEDLKNCFSFCFAILIALATAIDVCSWIKKQYKRYEYTFISRIIGNKKTNEKINKALEKIQKRLAKKEKRLPEYFPITYVALKLHLMRSSYEK